MKGLPLLGPPNVLKIHTLYIFAVHPGAMKNISNSCLLEFFFKFFFKQHFNAYFDFLPEIICKSASVQKEVQIQPQSNLFCKEQKNTHTCGKQIC